MGSKSTDGFRLTGSELIVYVMICFVVVVSCYRRWNRRHFDRVAAKLRGPPAYPIVGSGLEFIGTPEDIYKKIIKLSNDFGLHPFKIWMGSSFFVCIGKPEDIQIVLNSSNALEKGQIYNFLKNTLGEGLIAAPVHKWKRRRRIISPVFNTNLADHFFPVFIDKTGILIENLKKEVGKTKTFDLLDYIAPTTLNIICQTAMGYNLGAQSNKESEFAKALIKISEVDSMRMYKPWLYPEFLFKIYAKLTGLDKLYKIFHTTPIQIIKEMKEAYAKKTILNDDVTDPNEGKRRKVFLDTLLELNETGANFSENELRDEVEATIIGGSETISVTSSCCLLLLAIHQDIQDKVYDELYEVFGDSDETIRFEDTSKLVYMEQVIKETLRIYPTVPLFLRRLQDDVKIFTDGLVLPKGSTCALSPLLTHFLPDVYPNPWKFDPERFSAENVAKRHKYSYLPLSGGPRGCIGSKYAMLSMKVLLSTLLRNYSVHTDMKLADLKFRVDMLLRSTIGYPVTIHPRDRRPTYDHIYRKLIKLSNDFGIHSFKIWMGSSLFVGIGNPEDIQIVLNNPNALEKDQIYNTFKNTAGEVTAPVHKWKMHSRVISPMFNTNLLDHFSPAFNEKIGILIENLKKEVEKTKTFVILDYIAYTKLDIICHEYNSYNSSEYN